MAQSCPCMNINFFLNSHLHNKTISMKIKDMEKKEQEMRDEAVALDLLMIKDIEKKEQEMRDERFALDLLVLLDKGHCWEWLVPVGILTKAAQAITEQSMSGYIQLTKDEMVYHMAIWCYVAKIPKFAKQVMSRQQWDHTLRCQQTIVQERGFKLQKDIAMSPPEQYMDLLQDKRWQQLLQDNPMCLFKQLTRQIPKILYKYIVCNPELEVRQLLELDKMIDELRWFTNNPLRYTECDDEQGGW